MYDIAKQQRLCKQQEYKQTNIKLIDFFLCIDGLQSRAIKKANVIEGI